MTADWQKPGSVVVSQEADSCVVRVSGNLHRDIDAVGREVMARGIRELAGNVRLLLNLRDVVTIDSWGEGLLVDLIMDVVAASGRVAILEDPNRPYFLRGLFADLGDQGEAVLRCTDEAKAKTWLGEARA